MPDVSPRQINFEVQVLDEQGAFVGTKAWNEVDRSKDILANAFIFVLTPERTMLLATLTEAYLSRKIYKGKQGAPAATLLRFNEPPEHAARRALIHDLAIYPENITLLGEQFETFEDGTRRLMYCFYAIHDQNVKINEQVLGAVRTITRIELETEIKLQPESFSPQFKTAFTRYKRMLPF